MTIKWTKEDERFLRNNYQTKTDREIAERLNVSVGTVRSKLESMGLKRKTDKTQERKIKEKKQEEELIYDPKSTYEIGDKIFHKQWNDKGKVEEIWKTEEGTKVIDVLFSKVGRKTLVIELK